MSKSTDKLTRRERQIMDVIYRQGGASVAEVIAGIDDPPGYSAVRALLAILERKGQVKHIRCGLKYVYQATCSREAAAQTAMKRLLQTFFENSTEKAVAAFLDLSEPKMSEAELKRLAISINLARKETKTKQL